MPDDDRLDPPVDSRPVEEEEQRDAEDDVRDHERAQEQRGCDRLAAEAADEREGREHAEADGAHAGDRGDDSARLQSRLEVRVSGELPVPLEREPAERERRQLGVVEREQQEDRDRRIEEHDHEVEEDPERPQAVLREGDVHQPAATRRDLEEAGDPIRSKVTTPSKKRASTEPVCQSRLIPKRSAISLPNM